LEKVVEIRIDGVEETLRRIIREELARAREGWLNAQEAAEYLGVSRASLHNLVSSGRLPRPGDKGTALRFRPSDLDAYAETRR
jgi:excisionase family DNA binding protein